MTPATFFFPQLNFPLPNQRGAQCASIEMKASALFQRRLHVHSRWPILAACRASPTAAAVDLRRLQARQEGCVACHDRGDRRARRHQEGSGGTEYPGLSADSGAAAMSLNAEQRRALELLAGGPR